MRVRQRGATFRSVADYVWLYGLFLIPLVAYLISVSPSPVGWEVTIVVALFMILTGGSLIRWVILWVILSFIFVGAVAPVFGLPMQYLLNGFMLGMVSPILLVVFDKEGLG